MTQLPMSAAFRRGLVIGLIVCSVGHGNADASSITVDTAPVATLADGRIGAMAFLSVTPRQTEDYLRRRTAEPAVVTGVLTLPDQATGPVPAVIILHGSSGINPGEWAWASRMNAMGFASFVIDSFTGRKIIQTETDQTQLSMTADMADGYFALRLLATHPAIDSQRIAVMGFSRGGVAALYSALEPFRHAVIDDNLRFAAHVAFYPGCSINYTSAHLDGSPILMLLGGKDDYTPAAPCIAYADALRANGAQAMVRVFPDGNHGFDRASAPHFVQRATSARLCHGTRDLDSGLFTVSSGDRIVSGAEANAAARMCLSTGVTIGGDPEGREQSPLTVAAFLRSAFGLAR
jgi:dienelactone hydrolase